MLTDVRFEKTTRRNAVAWVPWLLALFFGLWSLQSLGTGGIVDTDAARHAMNGAFIHDMAAAGRLIDPVGFGESYYSRLPALSLPYHPPLFPVFESISYSVFGVNLFAARLVVALSMAVSALLFYSLVAGLTGSPIAAFCSVATFFACSISGTVGRDVMLEFPSMVLVLGALHVIRNLDAGLSLRRGIAFAVLAGAAVWTKQHALFLGAVPVLAAVLLRRYGLLWSRSLWISLALFGAACGALAALSLPFKAAGVDQLVYEIDRSWFREVPLDHLIFYARSFPQMAGPAAMTAILAAIPVLIALRGRIPGLWLFASWAASSFGLLLVLGPADERYFFYVYPAVLAMAYAALAYGCAKWLGPKWKWAPAVCALLAAAPGIASRAPYLEGPEEVAAALVSPESRRILYCGNTDGNFIFAVRSLDPSMKTVVVAGEKLLANPPDPARLREAIARYRISHVVLERTARSQPCNAVSGDSIPGARLEQTLPLRSSLERFDGGSVSVYRVETAAEPNPPPVMKVPIPRIGREVDLEF